MLNTNASVRAHRADVILIGGGIASATLACLLTELEPKWSIVVLEKLDEVGKESSDGWNNAGTGHSALCELNYTPQDIDGAVDPAKAVRINEQFQLSRQLWASLVREGKLTNPSSFIRQVPHMSFVRGMENVDFLTRRYEALKPHPLFDRMEFTTSHTKIAEWAPLITEGRPVTESVAATRSPDGTDVDFGALTRALFDFASSAHTRILTGHNVVDFRRMGREWGVMSSSADGTWVHRAPFVFIGAGGNALPLLQQTGIAEIEGFGGFPISGQWLRCTNPKIVQRHHAKVYGKAAVGAPPMSVPHLDTRVINGRRELMFGPYAGWSPKFLKTGSVFDLARSVRPGNIREMIAVAPPNIDLMTYLVGELAKGHRARMAALREFMPQANADEWELVTAGQRVQVIAPDAHRTSVLQFGTQLIVAADHSLAGMLGASPGASTAVDIMLRLLGTAFPSRATGWRLRLQELVPSFAKPLSLDPDAAHRSLAETAEVLGLAYS